MTRFHAWYWLHWPFRGPLSNRLNTWLLDHTEQS